LKNDDMKDMEKKSDKQTKKQMSAKPGAKAKAKAKAAPTRKVLVILSNRLNRLQPARFFELECDDQGNIYSEKKLRAQPKQPQYAEVWENDDGKTEISSCNSFKRKYRHPLEKRAA
jgi:hypothetical protein